MLKIRNTIYSEKYIDIEFDLLTGKGKKEIHLELQVVTDNNTIQPMAWEKPSTIGTPFPLEFTKLVLNHKSETVTVNNSSADVEFCDLIISVLRTEKYGVPCGISIYDRQQDNNKVSGTLSFRRDQKDILGAVSITQKGEAER